MARYIEQSLSSVLSQNYPNLEYIVIDGGSTDGTQQIIERYSDRLSYYCSEPDNGMYDALAKGFQHATGDILAWLNADDVYFPWTFRVVNEIFTQHKDILWIGGRYAFLREDGNILGIRPKCCAKSQRAIANGWCRDGVLGVLQQESMFWRKELYQSVGGLSDKYKYAGDFELWMRFAKNSSLSKVDLPLAAFRKRSSGLSSKCTEKYADEVKESCHGKKAFPNIVWQLCYHSPNIVRIFRFLHFSRITVFYYNQNNGCLKRKKVWLNSSNFTLSSLMFID